MSFLRFSLTGLLVALLACPHSGAQDKSAALFWDVNYISEFNNGEYDISEGRYTASGTIAVARLSPYAGLRIGEEGTGLHTIVAGIDILKDFGTYSTGDEGHPDNWDLFKEITLYYKFDRSGGNDNRFTAVAGVFPRFLCEGEYDTSILSDANRIYDNNLEGMLLKWRGPRGSFSELALDWNGKFGAVRREEFNVITAGHIPMTRRLSFDWQGMFHHYANSETVVGVVDDNLLKPYIKLDVADLFHLESPFMVREMALSAGAILGYHRDRRFDEYFTPAGVFIGAEAAVGNFGFKNNFYHGGNHVPYYDGADAAGIPYADNLYMRSLMWKQLDSKDKTYDRMELYWQPRLGAYTSLKFSVVAHFHNHFCGWQQIATLVFSLDKGRNK